MHFLICFLSFGSPRNENTLFLDVAAIYIAVANKFSMAHKSLRNISTMKRNDVSPVRRFHKDILLHFAIFCADNEDMLEPHFQMQNEMSNMH